MKVYLAGPISGLDYDQAVNWRESVTRELANYHIQCYSPMRGKNHLRNFSSSVDHTNPLTTPKGIFARDFLDCTTSDLLIVNLKDTTKISIGTVMELSWAYVYRIPCIVIINKDNVHQHPMLDQTYSFSVSNTDEAIQLTKDILLP